MTITILAENTALTRNVLGEHGLAFWLESQEHRLLFDTGQGRILTDNAQALGVDLHAVNTIVLSHGHYDHTGALPTVLHQATGVVMLHAHPDALLPKYRRNQSGVREIGMSEESRAAITGERCRFIPSRRVTQVAPGLYATGEIPRRHPEETITESFCRDPLGRDPDLLLDDQALYFDSPFGSIVLLGCAHAGIINTLDHVQTLTGNQPLHAVIGGTHLRAAHADRLDWTIRELRRFNIACLVPLHCTGQPAGAALWSAFPNTCREGGAGTVFEFQERLTTHPEQTPNPKGRLSPMKIAIPIAEGKLCMHFGHCNQFALLDVDEKAKTVTNKQMLTPPPHEPGVLPRWLHDQGATVIIAGGMGSRAQNLFAENGIQVVVGAPAETPETLVAHYLTGTLVSGTNVCDH